SVFAETYQPRRPMTTSELSVIACFRDFGRGHANGACRSRSTAPVEISALSTPPHTRVQYRNPATANPTMLIASTRAWLRSMNASALKRRSRCSSASGTVLNDVSQRSEEHTSELQSRGHLVCRLLLEKKKKRR